MMIFLPAFSLQVSTDDHDDDDDDDDDNGDDNGNDDDGEDDDDDDDGNDHDIVDIVNKIAFPLSKLSFRI